jgi:hypothetical protein
VARGGGSEAVMGVDDNNAAGATTAEVLGGGSRALPGGRGAPLLGAV